MIRKIFFCCLVFFPLTTPGVAQELCAAPDAPAIPAGAKATQAQILATQNSLRAFAAASDNFQACIAREIERQKSIAKEHNADVDPAIQAALEARGTAQRKDAERLATAWRASVEAFTAAQQRRERQNPPSVPSAIRGTMGMSGGSAYGGNPY